MAESIQTQIDTLEEAKSALTEAIPLLITPSRTQEGLQFVAQGADHLEKLEFDQNFSQLSTTMKILANGDSMVLGTVTFQSFVVDVLEMITSILEVAKNSELPQDTDVLKYLHVGEFLVNMAGRVTNRYKLNVLFEPEYEAKSLRAFMVVKELSNVVRFLNLAPDISENQNANLDNGLEVDCLSQASPNELHRIAGSVLEVQSVQVFRETKAQPINMLDPPSNPESFDKKIEAFLNE